MKKWLKYLPVLSNTEKTTLGVLLLILGSGAGLRALETSGLEMGPVRDWESLRKEIVRAESNRGDSVFPCGVALAPTLDPSWPERTWNDSVAEQPLPARAKSTPGRSTTKKQPKGRVDLNTAEPELLEQLPGVGPATAKAIVIYRQENGPFRSTTDLLKIKGIGTKKCALLIPWVRLNSDDLGLKGEPEAE